MKFLVELEDADGVVAAAVADKTLRDEIPVLHRSTSG